ncbi:MAG: c-type cytochrome [Polyangiaceae bacterium]
MRLRLASLRPLAPVASVLAAMVGAALAASCGPAQPSNTPVVLACDETARDPMKWAVVSADDSASTVALVRPSGGPLAGATLAAVADADGRAIYLVDIDQKKTVSTIALDGSPTAILPLADGRFVVTVRETASLRAVHASADGTLILGCSAPAPVDPVAIARSGEQLIVAGGFSNSLQSYAVSNLAQGASATVAREPRQIAPQPDGTLFVTHAVAGKVSVVKADTLEVDHEIRLLSTISNTPPEDEPPILLKQINRAVEAPDADKLGQQGTRIGSYGYSAVSSKHLPGRLFVPHALVDPGDPKTRTGAYSRGELPRDVGAQGIIAVGSVAVVDTATNIFVNGSQPVDRAQIIFEDSIRQPNPPDTPTSCLLPRAAIIDDATTSLLVSCLGIDVVLAYDAASSDPSSVERARWNVAAGPTGLALDSEHRRAVVFAQFERQLQVLDLNEIDANQPSTAELPRIDLPKVSPATSVPFLLGRQLFYSAGDARLSAWGLACASCHIDGRDDGLTWSTPDGPRRTLPLRQARIAHGPLGWDGDSKDRNAYMRREFERLRARGLPRSQIDALFTYVDAIQPVPAADAASDPLIQRGKAVFESASAKCASCHIAGGSDGKLHDIGSHAEADKKRSFLTPPLEGVRGRAPYFHDGRFATLEALVAAPHFEAPDSAPDLSKDDQAALVAYLHAL